MTSTAKKREDQTFEQRKDFIQGFCFELETKGLPNLKDWRASKKLFSDFSDADFEQIALGSSELNVDCILDGPALTPNEVVIAISEAVYDKNPEREKGGMSPSKTLVTVNHILFQFYLMKSAFRAASR